MKSASRGRSQDDRLIQEQLTGRPERRQAIARLGGHTLGWHTHSDQKRQWKCQMTPELRREAWMLRKRKDFARRHPKAHLTCRLSYARILSFVYPLLPIGTT